MKNKEYDSFIEMLINYSMEADTQELSRFKIVQLISSIKAQCINQKEDIFTVNKEKWLAFANTLSDSILGHATSKLINNIYFVKRSPFGQPRFVSSSTPIVRTTTNEKEILI